MTDKIETAIDEMLLAAIVSGEEVAAIALFGEFRAAGLDPVRSAQKVLMELDLFEQRLREARIALAQQAPTPAVLPEPIPLCMCKDRLLVDCSGEWGPGCDLGNNEKHVRVSDVSGCLACVTCGAPAAISEPAASEEWINDKPDAADYVNDRSEPAAPVDARTSVEAPAYDGHTLAVWQQQARHLIGSGGTLVRGAHNNVPGPSPCTLANWIQDAQRAMSALVRLAPTPRTAEGSEPAAPVDARDALIEELQKRICQAKEVSMFEKVVTWRDCEIAINVALTRQAAAPEDK